MPTIDHQETNSTYENWELPYSWKNRDQGEGRIFKRKDGLWDAQVTLQGRRLSKYAKRQGFQLEICAKSACFCSRKGVPHGKAS